MLSGYTVILWFRDFQKQNAKWKDLIRTKKKIVLPKTEIVFVLKEIIVDVTINLTKRANNVYWLVRKNILAWNYDAKYLVERKLYKNNFYLVKRRLCCKQHVFTWFFGDFGLEKNPTKVNFWLVPKSIFPLKASKIL